MVKKKLLKSILFSVGANFSTLIVSSILLIMLPNLIGVKGFGYWQLYLLFTTYTALLHFGWVDGIYLKHGGEEYNNLDKKLLSNQFFILTTILFIIVCLASFFLFESNFDLNKKIIYISVFFSALFVIPRGFLIMILQATDRIKDYSKLTIYTSIMFILMLVNLFLFKVSEFYIFVLIDLIVKFFSLLITMYVCKDLFLNINFRYKENKKLKNEIFDNIKSGINVAIAYVAGVLIIGIVRQGVEIEAGIIEFSNLSLSLNFVNVILIFLNALAVVFFPIIKKSNALQKKKYYSSLNKKISNLFHFIFLLYYPLLLIINYYFPDFKKVSVIFCMIFPIILLEGKNTILNIVYLKSLRKEKIFLFVNMFLVLLSAALTYIIIIKLDFYNYASIIIVLILALKYLIMTLIIAKEMSVNISSTLFQDIFLVVLFIVINNQLSFGLSFLVMCIISLCNLIFYLINKKNKGDAL